MSGHPIPSVFFFAASDPIIYWRYPVGGGYRNFVDIKAKIFLDYFYNQFFREFSDD